MNTSLEAAPTSAVETADLMDLQIIRQYAELNPWGMATGIDLGGCDPELIRSADSIRDFVVELCHLIQMKRFGEPTIVRFGRDPRVSGYSLAQLIETSLISGHFAEESDSAYIDIFSCKAYGPYRAARFCRDWFGAATMKVNVSMRSADKVPAA
ncbi:MAG: S-adenosylmethionine decarboxylase [Actinomycetota bacterium]